MRVGATGRIAIGSLLLGVVGASFLLASSRAHLALPAIAGVVWGVVNVWLLARLVANLRPDRPTDAVRVLLDLGLKFPAMYVVGFLLLRPRPLDEIITAVAGFTLVLVVMLLRALGWLLTQRSTGGGVVDRLRVTRQS